LIGPSQIDCLNKVIKIQNSINVPFCAASAVALKVMWHFVALPKSYLLNVVLVG
jgi:hypothetical protein